MSSKDEINVVNKATGEIFTFPTDNDANIAMSYHNISQTIKALERAKDKIKIMALDALGDDDQREVGAFKWKRTTSEYRQYDMTTLRAVLDEDLFATVVSPNKSMIDGLIAEGVKTPDSAAITPEMGAELRRNMYTERTVTKLTLELS